MRRENQQHRGGAAKRRRGHAPLLRAALAVLLGCAVALAAPASGRADWILIDTKALTLSVFDAKDHMIARFDNIAIGSGGVSDLHFRGDETTPLGRFRVAWIDRDSPFGIFYGLGYPTASAAARAYLRGRIAWPTFEAIFDASRRLRLPPQDTQLGGDLGIHGIGSGPSSIQRYVNWTDGCVAVTNRQARELSRWIHVGTRVIIR